MWIYTRIGLLLPTAAADNTDRSLTNRGQFNLQVAARTREILNRLCRLYMIPGTFSDVYECPMDGFRIFTTRAAFAHALNLLLEEIDYSRFDPVPVQYDYEQLASPADESAAEPLTATD